MFMISMNTSTRHIIMSNHFCSIPNMPIVKEGSNRSQFFSLGHDPEVFGIIIIEGHGKGTIKGFLTRTKIAVKEFY